MKTVAWVLLTLVQLTLINGSASTQHKCVSSSCLTASAQELVKTIASGIPELGVERLDPMFIEDVLIDHEGYKTNWTGVSVGGLKDAVIDDLSINMESKEMHLSFHSNYYIKGHYVVGGHVLSVPISGEGEGVCKLKNVDMQFDIRFEIVKDVQGRSFMKLKDYQYWSDIKEGYNVHLDNLYYGNYELSRKMHTLLHDESKILGVKYGRFLFDKTNVKIFNAIQNYMSTRPLDIPVATEPFTFS